MATLSATPLHAPAWVERIPPRLRAAIVFLVVATEVSAVGWLLGSRWGSPAVVAFLGIGIVVGLVVVRRPAMAQSLGTALSLSGVAIFLTLIALRGEAPPEVRRAAAIFHAGVAWSLIAIATGPIVRLWRARPQTSEPPNETTLRSTSIR